MAYKDIPGRSGWQFKDDPADPGVGNARRPLWLKQTGGVRTRGVDQVYTETKRSNDPDGTNRGEISATFYNKEVKPASFFSGLPAVGGGGGGGGGGATDALFSQVDLLLKTNGAITDASNNGATITLNGDTTQSGVQTKFASQSMLFDGNGDYLTVPAAPFDFSADFTIEGWVWKSADGINSYDGFVSYGSGSSASDGLFIEASATRGVTLVVGGVGVVLSDNQSPNTSSWIHIAVTREGNTTRIFQNGILTASTTSGYSVPSTATIVQVGRCEILYTFNGYMEDVRVTCGTARYTAAFTPPTAEFPTS